MIRVKEQKCLSLIVHLISYVYAVKLLFILWITLTRDYVAFRVQTGRMNTVQRK